LNTFAYTYWRNSSKEELQEENNNITIVRLRTKRISLNLTKDNLKKNKPRSIEILEFQNIEADVDVSPAGVRAEGRIVGLKSNTLLPSKIDIDFNHVGRGLPNARLVLSCKNPLRLVHYQQRLFEIQDYFSPGLINVACALCGSFDDNNDSTSQPDFKVKFHAPSAFLITPNGPYLEFKNGIDVEYTDTSMRVSLFEYLLGSKQQGICRTTTTTTSKPSELSINVTFATPDTPTNVSVNLSHGTSLVFNTHAYIHILVRLASFDLLDTHTHTHNTHSHQVFTGKTSLKYLTNISYDLCTTMSWKIYVNIYPPQNLHLFMFRHFHDQHIFRLRHHRHVFSVH